MFCPNCGLSNSDDSKFCAGCGNPLQSAQQAPQAQNYQQPYQQVYTAPQAQKNDILGSVMNYQQPENAIVKAPFPAFILKISKVAIWLFYFIGIFFAWIFLKASYWGQSETEKFNLFKLVFDDYYSMDGIEGGGFLTFIGVLTLIVIVAVIVIQVLNIVLPGKLSKIPQIALCAAPAVITFIFMIVAWIVMGGAVAEYKEWGMDVSAGPGFGAWFVLILSLIETALHVVFMKDKDAPLFK